MSSIKHKIALSDVFWSTG